MTGATPTSATGSVVVIGGGLAGITAALDAAEAGAAVTLVERRSRLGGLTWSFARDGRWFDNGQHVFLRCCTAYLELLGRLGVADDVALQARMDVPVLSPGRPLSRLRRNGLPAPLHLSGALARYRPVPLRERLRIPLAALALRSIDPSDPALDRETFGAWLRRHRQGEHAWSALWDLITLPTVNLPADEASLALAAKVFRTGLLDASDAGDIGWSKVPLARLHDEPARRALDAAGVKTLLGTPVAAIEPAGRGTPGRWSVHTEETDLEADAVIVAVPPPVAARLVPAEAQIGDVAALGASPIVNVHLVYDRRVTDLSFAAALESPVQFVFDRTASSGTRRGQCLAVSLSAADRWIGLRPDELIKIFTEALGDLFPAARHARVVDAVVTREHEATFRGVPGTLALRPGPRTQCPGLAMAGAWTDTGWPATMEGAVRSGHAAAGAVLSESAPRNERKARNEREQEAEEEAVSAAGSGRSAPEETVR